MNTNQRGRVMFVPIGHSPPFGSRFPPTRFVCLALAAFVSIGVHSWLNRIVPAGLFLFACDVVTRSVPVR